MHGFNANLFGAVRTTYIVSYGAADTFAYTAPVNDSCHCNRMVRGESARNKRVEQGKIELSPTLNAGCAGIFTLFRLIRRSGSGHEQSFNRLT